MNIKPWNGRVLPRRNGTLGGYKRLEVLDAACRRAVL